jgi:hypothetical protein
MKTSPEARRVLRELTAQLGDGLVWTPQESEVLSFIESEINRKVDLERDYASAETSRERVSIGRELRLTKSSIARLLSKISTEESVSHPETRASARARRAAIQRWHPAVGA